MILAAAPATGIGISETMILGILNVFAIIYVVYLNVKLTNEKADDEKHLQEHSEMNKTIAQHTKDIQMCDHEINNFKQVMDAKCETDSKNTTLLIQIKCGLQALMVKNDVDPKSYFN
jgi:hypothetical protein